MIREMCKNKMVVKHFNKMIPYQPNILLQILGILENIAKKGNIICQTRPLKI